MANQEHVHWLKQGVEGWNQWRKENPDIKPNLSGAYLRGANLNRADLIGADLSHANLIDADLMGADLIGAILSNAYLNRADLSGAILRGAILSNAILSNAILRGVDLSDADLSDADLIGAILSNAILSNADLSGAILSRADLSRADLSGAKMEDVTLTSANLSEAHIESVNLIRVNLEGANLKYTHIKNVTSEEVTIRNATLDGLENEAISQLWDHDYFSKNISHIGKKLKQFDSDEEKVDLNTTLELANLINTIIKHLDKEKEKETPYSLSVSDEGVKKIINVAFKISLKKEESRFPHFQFYVPGKNKKKNSEASFKYIIKFEKEIELNNISTLHRISAGIPQRPYAILVHEKDDILKADGIIRIENTYESISYLKDIATHHSHGLTISIEDPGSLNVLFYPRLDVIVQLSFREGRVQVNHDVSLNPLAQEIYEGIAQKLKDDKNNHSRLTQLIGGIWNYILKLAVEFNQGGQFIIVSQDKDILRNLDIKYCVEKEKTNLGKYIQDNIKESTLSQELLDCARLIAHLSTVDGAVVLDDKLDLIGFGAIVRDGNNIDGYETPNITLHFQDLYDYIYGKAGNESKSLEKTPDNEQSSSDVNNDKKRKPWDRKNFGTRHNSAFKFCVLCHQHNLKSKYSLELKPSVFVVSQDGDIRIFRQCGKPTDQKIGVCGPLRPLWLPFS